MDLGDFCARLPGQPRAALVQSALQSALISVYHGSQDPRAQGLSIVFYQLPAATTWGTYDLDYAPLNQATGAGSALAFLNAYSWPGMMYTYVQDQFPATAVPAIASSPTR